nr:MAG TPA: hypothetical protein [Caudoviricetes sp.]
MMKMSCTRLSERLLFSSEMVLLVTSMKRISVIDPH